MAVFACQLEAPLLEERYLQQQQQRCWWWLETIVVARWMSRCEGRRGYRLSLVGRLVNHSVAFGALDKRRKKNEAAKRRDQEGEEEREEEGGRGGGGGGRRGGLLLCWLSTHLQHKCRLAGSSVNKMDGRAVAATPPSFLFFFRAQPPTVAATLAASASAPAAHPFDSLLWPSLLIAER